MALDSYAEIQSDLNLIQLSLTDITTPKAVIAIAAPPRRIDHIILSSTSASDHDVALYAHITNANYMVAVVSVPAGAGTSAVPPVDLVAALPGAFGGLAVSASVGLYIGCLVALSGAEVINAVAIGGYL